MDREYSQKWLEQFSAEIGFSLDEVLIHAEEWLNTGGAEYKWDGKYWNEGSTFEGQSVPEEFSISYVRAVW